jgi:hypothetical protein
VIRETNQKCPGVDPHTPKRDSLEILGTVSISHQSAQAIISHHQFSLMLSHHHHQPQSAISHHRNYSNSELIEGAKRFFQVVH